MAIQTIRITLDEELVKCIDAVVNKDASTRSEYLRDLALADLEHHEQSEQLFAAGRTVSREMDAGGSKRIGYEGTSGMPRNAS